MLKSLKLQNFRSCVDTQVEFSPVTLLIGRNNTGKSSICQALRFLSATTSAPSLDEAARGLGISPRDIVTRWRSDLPTEIVARGVAYADDEPLAYEYGLQVRFEEPGLSTALVLTKVQEWLLAGEIRPTTVLLDGGSGGVRTSSKGLDGMDPIHETNTHYHRTHLNQYYHLHPWTAAIREHLASWRYYRLSTTALRESRRADYDAYLKDDGSNLASVLYTLKNEDSRRFEMLMELVREVEPSIHALNFIRPRPEEVWMEIEDTEGNRFGPESLSDGTLNYLAMCYVALQGQIVTHRDTRSPGLVCFEEPENGLWVGHLRRLFEVIQEGGKTQQMILTTHNPYLVDLFEGHLDQVRLVKRGDLSLREGTTVTTPDPEKVGEMLEHFTLGEQYYRGLLE